MSDSKLQRFGKYLILDHLVDGGMAKICRARFLGEQGSKVVAIKMVQPQYSKDESFVQMFEDELKVTFGLLHPNIVQMFDYGIVNEQLYTAMEYVDGGNLKEFADRLKEKNFVFPVEITTYIISQVCQGLHYAHTFTDKLTGKPFNIIHRDISPHNIMLTYDGAIKVIDFGIAKADSNSEATQAGTIKGKLSYLAPEYLDGLELDPRYDLFAVGITIWELLCSRKLFTANNDLAVLKQIQACKIPIPSSINPNVPKELDAIVLKALSKDRNQRYENLDKFNRALVKFLYSNYPDFNATDLGYFAKQLFKTEISADKEKFVEFGKIDITPFLKELKNEADGITAPGPVTPSADGVASIPIEERTKKIELDLALGGGGDDVPSLDLDFNHGATSTSVKKPGSTRASSVDGENTRVRKKRTAGTSTTNRVKSKSGTRTRTKVVNSGKSANDKKGGNSLLYGIVASFMVLGFVFFQAKLIRDITGLDVVSMMGGESESQKVIQNRNIAEVQDEELEDKATIGLLTFINYDTAMTIYVNNKKIVMKGLEGQVPLFRNLRIEIRKAGFKKEIINYGRLDANKFLGNVTIPDLVVEKIGLLSTSANFTSGSVIEFTVDGEKISRDLPLNNYRVPAGTYQGIIANPLLGTEKKVKFKIEENKRFFLE